jgi:ribosomal-protein-alanine N-acetyltransferase
VIYRRWTFSDNGDIAAIEKQTFKTPWSLEMINKTTELDNFYGVVCCADDAVVGYVGCIFDPWDGEILNVAVKQDFRRQKIAETLMTMILEFLQKSGKEQVYLEVRKSNAPARLLYEKLGFKPIGERKKYYENTEDAVVMAKLLKGEN